MTMQTADTQPAAIEVETVRIVGRDLRIESEGGCTRVHLDGRPLDRLKSISLRFEAGKRTVVTAELVVLR